MELTTRMVAGTTYMSGNADVTLSQGEKIIIKAPGGTQLLSATVPLSKQWTVRISVEVFESGVEIPP